MDGIDGIAGLQGLIAAAAWCFAASHLGASQTLFISALLAGGCAGFLFYNWSPAKIFMGDVGSAFLGFVFGVTPLVALHELAQATNTSTVARIPVFAVLVVWPFVADGSITFCRRLFNHEPVWKPHRSHLYQRMVRSGWSHATVTLYYGGWAALCSGAALSYLLAGIASTLLWCVAGLFGVVTLSLTVWLERKGSAVSR
jgi:UDP-N-acetylmuramyl pentapeptide phosphotransferase/UDP-N-acetylglucosamine-1-phosphate transferase